MLPRWLIGFRALALASAFAAAFVPIATYITDDKRDWLWIHIGVNIAAYIAVALTTIYTTISLTQQDHNKYRVPAYWANNVIIRTWYLGVSKTWSWHVAAAVGRLGLALALAQHVVVTYWIWPNEGIASVVNPFIYRAYNTLDYDAYRYAVGYSQWETVVISFCILLIFGLLETALLSSMTLLVKSAFYQVKGKWVVILRLGGVALITFTMYAVRAGAQHEYLIEDESSDYWPIPVSLFGDKVTVLEEWHKIAFTWLDNGTMIAAWITRPMTSKGNHACIYSEPDINNLDGFCTAYNNRLPVFTDILAAIAGCMTYILAIVVSLQFAHYLHWRREQGLACQAPTGSPIA